MNQHISKKPKCSRNVNDIVVGLAKDSDKEFAVVCKSCGWGAKRNKLIFLLKPIEKHIRKPVAISRTGNKFSVIENKS